MNKMTISLRLLFLACLLMVSNANAGKQSDALGQCLIKSTTNDDRNKLIVWMYAAASQHPVVKNMSTISDAQLEKANKEFADLTMKLLTVDCKALAKKAIKSEGLGSLQSSFQVFGEVAGRELFASPYVAKAMAGYVRHLDIFTLGMMLKGTSD